MLLVATTRRYLWLLPALLLLTAVSCDKKDPEPPVDPPVTPATPYNLTLPTQLPQGVVIPTNNPLTVEGVDLGRKLFYEVRLSRDNTMSCGSCHQQSKAFTDGRVRAIGVDGIAHQRNTMSLVNLLWEPKLNWDGSANSFETQARTPIENPIELHQSLADGVRKLQQTTLYPPLFASAFNSATITEENVLKALAQFERTLISSNTRYEKSLLPGGARLTADERAGRVLFFNHPGEGGNILARGGSCDHCHNGNNFLFTSTNFTAPGGLTQYFNNGLPVSTDLGRFNVTGVAADRGKFRVPTLRNIALTAPYMHDGRFQTLEEVVDHYNEHIDTNSADPILLLSNTPGGTKLDLTATEKRQLVAFLKTLTDSTFIQDARFSNPF
ncbi:cytochrome-c peroxidase [Hymenobacter sp.]|jgi:cytochrome c peroxidase|uniref:cytochrome-c peroxidase n=1 Tax=Hymenobacter sp. TaxID=1898978 RepID=UPI002ED8ECB9